jgi:hypothetical protein
VSPLVGATVSKEIIEARSKHLDLLSLGMGGYAIISDYFFTFLILALKGFREIFFAQSI